MINKKKKGGMTKRYANSYASRDSGSGSKGGVINYRKYDGEIKFFSPAEGKHRINIIPYVIKTKNHPLVKSGEAEIGEKDYVLDYYSHRGVGPAEKTVLCLKNTYGKPCPICEQAAALRKAGKEKEASALKPSRRVVYNIEDLKEPGVLKVFEASHYLFEKELIEEARDDDEGGFIDFADEEEGKEIKFRASKVTKNGMEFTEFKSFGFEDRDEELDEKLLDSAISFDELLEVPTYEEAEKILYGDDDDSEDEDEENDDEEDEKPTKKSSKKVVEDDEDDEDEPSPKSKNKNREEDEDDEEDGEEFEVPKKSSKKKSDEDDDDSEEDEEDEPPAKKSSKKSKKIEDDEDEDEEDEPAPKSKKSKSEEDDDEEDEKPAKKSSKKNCDGDCSECPFGHKFGTDCDDFDECDDCELWNKCVKASD
ncbi:hypothetical protein [Methanobrevibacter sp.]|uniref:hypothetical protein n=1 Tax=Methanobrevibacter sp. TaxID=66852 RepID=UPI003864E549